MMVPVDQEWIVDQLREAEKAVDASQIGKDLRPIAYAKVLELVLGGPASLRTVSRNGGVSLPTESVCQRIGSALNLDEATAESLFVLDDSDVRLSLARSKLPKQKAPAMRAIALLHAAARQAAGLD